MAQQIIGLGAVAEDGNGDGLRIGGDKINDNFSENYPAIALNTAKVTNVTTNLSEGTSTETTVDVNSSDGTNATLVAASTSRAGLLTKAKFDEIEANIAAIALLQVNVINVASDDTPNPSGDSKENEYYLTALTQAALFSAPSGSPTNGNTLFMRIQDDGSPRALSFNAIYQEIGTTLPSSTTANKKIYIGCIYDSFDAKWDVVSVKEKT